MYRSSPCSSTLNTGSRLVPRGANLYMLYGIYYRFVPPLGTTPLFRTLLPSAPVRSARIVAQVMGGWGGGNNNVHFFSDNTQTEHHKLLGRLQNPHLPCQTYFNRIQTEHQTLLNSDMHMFFFRTFFCQLWMWITDCIALLGMLQSF